MYWEEMSPLQKAKLIWGMRTAFPISFWGKIKENLSPKQWILRYKMAKATADFEAKHMKGGF